MRPRDERPADVLIHTAVLELGVVLAVLENELYSGIKTLAISLCGRRPPALIALAA